MRLLAATVDVLRPLRTSRFTPSTCSPDPALRQGSRPIRTWPTIPQLYIGGAFLGGCDIVRELHETGELAELIGSCRLPAGPAGPP